MRFDSCDDEIELTKQSIAAARERLAKQRAYDLVDQFDASQFQALIDGPLSATAVEEPDAAMIRKSLERSDQMAREIFEDASDDPTDDQPSTAQLLGQAGRETGEIILTLGRIIRAFVLRKP